MCEYQSYDTVFSEVARGIIESSVISCDFPMPAPPSTSSMGSAGLEFTPSNGGAAMPLQRVADEASCTPNGFYLSGSTLTLCPAACSIWRSDQKGSVSVLFACTPWPRTNLRHRSLSPDIRTTNRITSAQ